MLTEIVASERRKAAEEAWQMQLLARFAHLRPSGDPDNVMSEFAADERQAIATWRREAKTAGKR